MQLLRLHPQPRLNNYRRHYVSQIRKECILHRCTPFFVYTHLKIKRYGK
nr:MAG TPA: hypothetical protein [Caudoviricetes sp.]